MRLPVKVATAIVALTAGGLVTSASAQQFVNRDFETGSLNGWTITETTNGQTILQVVEFIDIDGPGPLPPSLAARFQVGSALATTGQQAGITLYQPLELAAGVPYLVSFNWASDLTTPATWNAEGGVFTLVVDGVRIRSENAGSIADIVPRFGFLQDVFVPSTTGIHQVGVRITRPFTILATTGINQWVDNFAVAPVAAGACCFTNGSCAMQTADLCAARDGVYRGDGVACEAASCPVPADFVAPFANLSVLGGTNGNVLTSELERTYQVVIAASELSGIVGMEITGLTWRLASPATTPLDSWPVVDANWSQYDIQLSTSLNPPNALSATFNNNVGPDAVMVRSGPLTIPALAFQGGAAAPALNPAGPVIAFASPFAYGGGDLLITVRHSGNDTGTSVNLDSIATSGSGYGVTVQARSAASATSATGTVAAFAVMQFSVDSGVRPCYANCDNSTTEPILNAEDFLCFISEYAQGIALPSALQIAHYANCDHSTTEPVLNVEDFSCFISALAQGCP